MGTKLSYREAKKVVAEVDLGEYWSGELMDAPDLTARMVKLNPGYDGILTAFGIPDGGAVVRVEDRYHYMTPLQVENVMSMAR